MLLSSLPKIINSISNHETDLFHNALIAVLDGVASRIINYKTQVGRGKVNWCHYEAPSGQRFATFISPKAFTGYKWNCDYSEVVNLETGASYRVSESHCTCSAWKYEVRAGKKAQCKHQVMRAEFVGKTLLQQHIFKVNPDLVPEGLKLQRSDDYTCCEYYLKAWHKENPFSAPYLKRLGRIIETDRGFMASGMRGVARPIFSYQQDAVAWLLQYNGISYQDIVSAYRESQKPQVEGHKCHKCGGSDLIPTWPNEPDYCPQCGWLEEKDSLSESFDPREIVSNAVTTNRDVSLAFGGFL